MSEGSRIRAAKAPTDKIRVLIADDHITVLEGLVAIIGREADMTVVAKASNGRDAVARWQEFKPDVSLLDLRMPFLDGLGAIEEIRRQDCLARIIVLTTFDTDEDISKAISAGAKGYLLKDSTSDVLLECIRNVHAGETNISPSLVAKLAAGLSYDPLTSRELEVLSLLALGLSNKEIAAKLSISETTVKSHMRGIFGKLNVLSRTGAVTEASRRGLIQIRR
jgi:DNA-binding NarL/FixJ family response regulator